jgi:hypothetical protein
VGRSSHRRKWLAVLFIGVFGPSMIFNNSSGYTKLPVVVVVAFFAVLGTIPVAKWAFRSRWRDND